MAAFAQDVLMRIINIKRGGLAVEFLAGSK
jgi:hypothetical protein